MKCIVGEPIRTGRMQPVQLVRHTRAGFVKMHHHFGLQPLFDLLHDRRDLFGQLHRGFPN